jgi:putative ABC transport system permease protein
MIYIKLAFLNLFRNTRRSFMILSTVALGTGALFLYHGFNYGIVNQYKVNTIHSRYGHGQINEKNYREKIYEKPWDHWLDNYQDLEKNLLATGKVKHVFPRVSFFALLTNGKINVAGKGEGVNASEEEKFFTQLNIVQGKNITDESNGVIVGQGIATSLDLKPGDTLTVLANTIYGSLNGVDLTVTGIFHTGVKEFDDTIFRMPLPLAQRLLDTTKIETVALGLYNDEDWNVIPQLINAHYPALEATPFAILDTIIYQHAIDFLAAQYATIRIIILTIAVLGIFNIVSISVLERKQEIGNLRANGESKFDIITLLLTEGFVIGLLGGLIGIGISYLINSTALANGILMPASPGFTRQFHILIELQPAYAFVSVFLGFATTLIGILMAGFKVLRTPIGELLRAY